MRCTLLTLCVATLWGCTLFQAQRYEEKYSITHLEVVLMDEDSLQAKYRELYGKPSLVILLPPDTIKRVRGFYDYETRTIYCPKMNFEVCGHELFHAIFGRFHPEP